MTWPRGTASWLRLNATFLSTGGGFGSTGLSGEARARVQGAEQRLASARSERRGLGAAEYTAAGRGGSILQPCGRTGLTGRYQSRSKNTTCSRIDR